MASKRTFEQAYRAFAEQHPDEAKTLTPEELAERIGYSVSAVRDYFRRQNEIRHQQKRHEEQQAEEDQIRALETGVVTFVTSSGSARVLYYPLLGEARIYSNSIRKRQYPSYHPYGSKEEPSLLFSPEDTIEIGIYLLGLQPHIREVIARREKPSTFAAVPASPSQPEYEYEL
jgi:hypothetical protein